MNVPFVPDSVHWKSGKSGTDGRLSVGPSDYVITAVLYVSDSLKNKILNDAKGSISNDTLFLSKEVFPEWIDNDIINALQNDNGNYKYSGGHFLPKSFFKFSFINGFGFVVGNKIFIRLFTQ